MRKKNWQAWLGQSYIERKLLASNLLHVVRMNRVVIALFVIELLTSTHSDELIFRVLRHPSDESIYLYHFHYFYHFHHFHYFHDFMISVIFFQCWKIIGCGERDRLDVLFFYHLFKPVFKFPCLLFFLTIRSGIMTKAIKCGYLLRYKRKFGIYHMACINFLLIARHFDGIRH